MRVSRHHAAVCLVSCGLGALLFGPAIAKQADPTQHCVCNMSRVNTGLLEYCQDYDEMLPLVVSSSQVEGVLLPYVKQRSYFDCPVTGAHYRVYTDLSAQSLAAIPNPYQVPTMHDGVPHPDGLETVAYLDGHLERGGVLAICDDEQSQGPCIANVRSLTLGTEMYAEDYDETLPNTSTYAPFKTGLYPYVKLDSVFVCPYTHYRYAPNPAISDEPLWSLLAPSTTVLLKDHVPHADGVRTFGWVDGHVSQKK